MEQCSTIKNVLVIEDEKDIREAVAEVLELEGYKVSQAENGQEGLNRLNDVERPCVILLDLMMPVMNGWEFAQTLERHPKFKSIPIVVVSAALSDEKNIRVKSRLKKPVEINALVEEVKSCCECIS